jgi:succinyl-CoA synthetase beta subunit
VASIALQQVGPSTSVAHFLAEAGVPVLPERMCTDLDAALDFATRQGYPVVLKVVSPDIPHKSEVGGVALHLTDARALTDAWRDMQASVSRLAPRAKITGYSVQPMLSGGFELIVGCSVDPELGRVLMVGAGGIWAEILDDVRFLALPASRAEIASALQSLRIAPILRGARGQPPLDVDAACAVIHRLAQQFYADSGIAEVDLNPLLVRPQGQGVMALDVLVVQSSTQAGFAQ